MIGSGTTAHGAGSSTLRLVVGVKTTGQRTGLAGGGGSMGAAPAVVLSGVPVPVSLGVRGA